MGSSQFSCGDFYFWMARIGRYLDTGMTKNRELTEEVMRLRTENERLRAALEEIARWQIIHPPGIDVSGVNAIARRALKGVLGQLTERQRKLAFEYRGPIANWDEDVPLK